MLTKQQLTDLVGREVTLGYFSFFGRIEAVIFNLDGSAKLLFVSIDDGKKSFISVSDIKFYRDFWSDSNGCLYPWVQEVPLMVVDCVDEPIVV